MPTPTATEASLRRSERSRSTRRELFYKLTETNALDDPDSPAVRGSGDSDSLCKMFDNLWTNKENYDAVGCS